MRHVPQRYAEDAADRKDRGRDPAHVIAPKAQERRVAAALRGKRVKGSGCSPYAKGDVVAEAQGPAPGWLLECKRTEKASLAVKRVWLVKIAREALMQGKRPALALAIAGGIPAADVETDWVLIPLSSFVALKQREEEGHDGDEQEGRGAGRGAGAQAAAECDGMGGDGDGGHGGGGPEGC